MQGAEKPHHGQVEGEAMNELPIGARLYDQGHGDDVRDQSQGRESGVHFEV